MSDDGDKISIGEASEKIGLPESTIRYYDREFSDFLNIPRGGNNERLFTAEILENLEYIRFLIKREDLSVEEVKKRLAIEEKFEGAAPPETLPQNDMITQQVPPDSEVSARLEELLAGFEDLKSRLDNLEQSQQQIAQLLDMNLQRYNKLVEHLDFS